MENVSVSVVEFRTEELMKRAVETVNKHNLNGRPLKVKEVGCWERRRIQTHQSVELESRMLYVCLCVYKFFFSFF